MHTTAHLPTPQRQRVDLAGGAISCLVWPNAGRPTVLFAHANGFNAETYRVLLAPLAASLQIVACDLRGHGFSTLPIAEDLAKDWLVFRDDLVQLTAAFEAPLLLAGHSLGATSALMAASRLSMRLSALLLIEPVLIPPLQAGDEPGASDLASRAERRRQRFASFSAAFHAYHAHGIFASWPDEVLADYLRGGLIAVGDGSLQLACAREWEAAIFRGAPHDRGSLAAEVACPLSIMTASKNSATSEQQLSTIQELRPDARIIVVEGTSHFLPMERPEVVRDELLRLSSQL